MLFLPNAYLYVRMCKKFNEEQFTRHYFGPFKPGITDDKMAKLWVY